MIVVTNEQIKAAWLSQRQQLYATSSEELERRRSFEEAIKRPYFHIKPLDAGQLVNWMRYLDYIEQKDDHPSTIRLYERCLVPCASYPGEQLRPLATGLCLPLSCIHKRLTYLCQ